MKNICPELASPVQNYPPLPYYIIINVDQIKNFIVFDFSITNNNIA